MTNNEPVFPILPPDWDGSPPANIVSPFLPQPAPFSQAFMLEQSLFQHPVPGSTFSLEQAFQSPSLPTKVFKPPVIGQTITVDGKIFTIGAQVGGGWFGSVYTCSDEWNNALVAKVLVPKDQTYEQVRENWMRELKNLLHLRHPNITYVHAAFEWEDTFYLIIERCTCTLDQLISYQGLQPDAWIPHVGRDILQGLDYIHDQDYVHKDIHPGNVFVAQTFDRMVPGKEPVWSYKIGDLGISRLEHEINVFNTVLAEWMMPPEALDPMQFGIVGKRTDIYHVGLLLLALLFNRMPTFSHQDILAGVPRQMAENHPSRFGRVIAKALRRHVADRTGSAMEFWREIRAAI